MLYLAIACAVGLFYVAWRVERIEGIATQLARAREAEAEQQVKRQPSSAFLPDEWTETPWLWKSRQEERRPLENPNILGNPDEFTTAEIIARFKSLIEPVNRIAFLSALRSRQTYFNATITAAVLRDADPLVRAWRAANLDTEFRDYTDYDFGSALEAPLIADFGEEIARDPNPLVRASRWKHSGYRDALWKKFGGMKDGWLSVFNALSLLEKLALMHNPGLSYEMVVSLLNAETADLNISREQHTELMLSAAQNPRLVLSSRDHGRDFWSFEGDANPPSKEFGEMWEACIAKWKDQPRVVYAFLKFIQTTPETKLKVYQALVSSPEAKYQRQAIIEGCDIFTDKAVLKAAWTDPDEECRKAVQEVVGNNKKLVGAKY